MNLFDRARIGEVVVRNHNSGVPRDQIASAHGLTEAQVLTILRHAREAGMEVRKAQRGRRPDPKVAVRSAEIQKRYERGETGPSIAKAMSVTVETVYSTLRRLGVERRVRPSNTERNQLIVTRYSNGESGVIIARDLSLTPKVVYDTLKKAGVVVRPRGVRPQTTV